MLLLRRYVVLLTLLFWQGGFMFYGAVTVPILREVFGSEGSFVTERVTVWINWAGTIAILIAFVDVFASPLAAKRWRWLMWLAMFVVEPVLVWMRHEMAIQMLHRGFQPSFNGFMLYWHKPYLFLSSGQWLAAMIFIWLTLRAWRAEDRQQPLAV
jgi:hypothetical protein